MKFLMAAALVAAMSSPALAYQDPVELTARADRYARNAEKQRQADYKRREVQRERDFQAGGGRYPIQADVAKAISQATGKDVSAAYWQAKRLKNGKYSMSGPLALVTGQGFYCLQGGLTFTRASYPCYYDNGAPFVDVIMSY